MARALRLRIEYKDINEVDTQINVYSEGFAGQYEEAPAGENPLVIDWGDKSTKGLPERYGSSAKVSFDAEVDYQYLDLFSADARANLVEVKKAGSVFWLGFMDSEDWDEPLISPPYPVSIKVYDGIGLLKKTPFQQTDGSAYEGEKTILEILQICLVKTGHELNFNTAVSFRSSGQLPVADSLTQHKKDVVIYSEMSCYEVLGQLFPACRIFQRGGEWYIISNDNWGKSSVSTYRYGHSGNSLGTGPFNPVSSQNWWGNNISKLKVMPALKHMDVEQDYGHKPNLFDNGDFTDGLNGWQTVGAFTPVVKALTDKDENYVYLPGQETLQLPPTKYIKTTLDVDQSTLAEPTKLTLDYALFGDGDGAHMFIRVKLTGSQVYYLRQFGNSNTKEIDYQWTLDGNDTATRLLMNFHYTDWLSKYPNGVNPDRVRSVSWEDLSDSFRQFKALIPTLIIPGTLEIQLCIAQTNDHNINGGACFKNIDIDILNEDQEELETGKTIRLTNNSNNNYTPDELKFVNGDLPGITNNKLIYQGGFLLSDGTPTVNWKVDGLTGVYTFTELIARLLASSMRQPRQAYNGKFADFIPGVDMVIIDPNNSNKKFIEAGISYNDRMQTVDGRYIEVIDDDLTGFTVSETPESSSGSSGGGGRSSSKDYNDQVAVYDHETVKELYPATFLSSKYFEVEANEIGNPLIVPKNRLISQNYIVDDVSPSLDPLVTGENATAIGEGTTADVYRMLALGSFNETTTGSVDSWISTDPLLVIGNGPDGLNKSTVLTMYKSGYTGFENALRIGAFDWGANNPENGALQYTIADGFQAYTNSAWHKFLFIDAAAENTKLTYYDATSLGLKTSSVTYSDLETHLADIATYSAINIDATAGQVIDTFTSDGKGHVTGISLRSLVAGDIPDLSGLYAGVNHNHDADYIQFGGANGQVWVSNGSGGGSWAAQSSGSTDYINLASFNTGTGLLSLSGVGSAGASVDLDGRYSLSGHTHSYDNYLGWNLRANTGASTFIGSGEIVSFVSGTDINVTRSGNSITINSTASGGSTYYAGIGLSLSGTTFEIDFSNIPYANLSLSDDFLFRDTSDSSNVKKASLSALQTLIGGGGSSYSEGSGIDITSNVISLDINSLVSSTAYSSNDTLAFYNSSYGSRKSNARDYINFHLNGSTGIDITPNNDISLDINSLVPSTVSDNDLIAFYDTSTSSIRKNTVDAAVNAALEAGTGISISSSNSISISLIGGKGVDISSNELKMNIDELSVLSTPHLDFDFLPIDDGNAINSLNPMKISVRDVRDGVSDIRLKQNINPIESLNVSSVPIKQFEFKRYPGILSYGIIAQDLQKVAPHLIREDASGNLRIKEFEFLVARIHELEQQVKSLTKKQIK